jgi:hypothetical protein
MKPRFQGIDNVYKTKADNKDIRDLLEKLVPEATKQMRTFSQSFRGATQEQTCRNIFNYIKANFRYVADQEEQIIKLPSALLRKKVGDCKSYSLFTAGILSNLGIPYHFVYASYNDNPIPHHVYVETDSGCKIDVVYGIFNQEKKAKYKYKKNMNVRYMAGLGDCGCKSCNSGMGKITIVSKEKRQAFKEDVKGAVKKVGEKAKDVFSDVKEGVKETASKALQKVKTATPTIAMGRGLFILLVKNNYDGLASRIALNDYTDLLNRWYKLGGNRTTLGEAIKEGSQKPERKLGFLNKLKNIVGDQPLQGVGIGKISAGLAASIIGLATAVATLISPEKATGAVAGASFGSVLVALLPALQGVLANLPKKSDEPLTQIPQTDAFDDGEGDIPTSQKLSKNLPLILGGVALLGVGIYFYTKKK